MAWVVTGFEDDGSPIWEDDGTGESGGTGSSGGGSSGSGGTGGSTEVTEITNTAGPGQEGYGWRYFSDGTAISPTGQYYTGGESGKSSLVYDPNKMSGTDLINKVLSGNVTTKDLTNYLTNNPKQVAGIIGGLAGAMSNATPNIQRVGYQGSIPKYEAVRQAVNYTDPNRRPGSTGRSYFSDTQFVPKDDKAGIQAAKTATQQQAADILSKYTPATAQTNPYVGKMERPWESNTSTTKADTTSAASGISSILNPNDMLKKYLPVDNKSTTTAMAHGGIAMLSKGRYLQGASDGMADKLPASIDGRQPAKLSHGEFVVPADVVSHLGNGNSDAGARKLYQMMDKIRMARTGTKKQGKQINPDKFMPGGAVGYASGGNIKGYLDGGTVDTTKPTYESNLSNWAGPEVTDMLARGKAVSTTPYQAYTGPLTAGASDLQQQAFAGISDIAKSGYKPTTFTGGLFDINAANQYMNPYIQAALDPQLKEMQRQSDIARLADASRLTKAGAYGGGRQAIMESEGRRNLLDKQTQAIGTGYQTAYDKAMQQFNADQQRRMEADKASEASRQYSADFGIKSVKDLADLGATQRAIDAEGVAADKAQFEEQRDYDKNMVKYMQSLFSGLPLATQGTSTATPNTLQTSAAAADTVIAYLTKLGVIKP